MDLEKARKDVERGTRPLRITTHAQVEAFKDGLLLADLRWVFDQGTVIEEYPDSRRYLLYAKIRETDVPVHVVMEDTPEDVVLVTAYIPDPREWIDGVRRRRRRQR